MSESMEDLQREMARTRARMSQTIEEIDLKVTSRVDAARERLDVVQLVRDHPWPALALAVGIGALLSSTGADTRVAAAAAAARTAGEKTADAARAAADAVSEKVADLRGGGDDVPVAIANEPAATASNGGGLLGGIVSTLREAMLGPLAGRSDDVLHELRGAAYGAGVALASAMPLPTRRRNVGAPRAETRGMTNLQEAASPSAASLSAASRHEGVLGGPIAPVETGRGASGSVRSVATTATIASATTDADAEAADEIPVPSEMFPVELDARADAVEALGGGSNEPPIVPGAGDLGARWA